MRVVFKERRNGYVIRTKYDTDNFIARLQTPLHSYYSVDEHSQYPLLDKAASVPPLDS